MTLQDFAVIAASVAVFCIAATILAGGHIHRTLDRTD